MRNRRIDVETACRS